MIETLKWTVAIVLAISAIMFAILWFVYMSVKLGTYAFFTGRSLFEKESEKGKELTSGKKSQIDEEKLREREAVAGGSPRR